LNNFLTPLLYVSFDLSESVDYDVKEIFYKRIIINAESESTKSYFDNTYKNKNDIDYNSFIDDIKSKGFHYFSDEDIVRFPIFISRYQGYFDVVSYKDIITETNFIWKYNKENTTKIFFKYFVLHR